MEGNKKDTILEVSKTNNMERTKWEIVEDNNWIEIYSKAKYFHIWPVIHIFLISKN